MMHDKQDLKDPFVVDEPYNGHEEASVAGEVPPTLSPGKEREATEPEHVGKQPSPLTVPGDESNATSLAMFSAYLAASHSWQWQYLVLLSEQQLNIIRKLGRRLQGRHSSHSARRSVTFFKKPTSFLHSSRRKRRTPYGYQKRSGAQSPSNISRKSPPPTGVHVAVSKVQHTTEEEPALVANIQRFAQGSWRQSAPSVMRTPARVEDAQHRTTHDRAGNVGQDAPEHPPTRGSRNLFQNFPIATYAKICVVLFFFNVPVYCIVAVGICGGIHASGVLNTFLERCHQWLEQAGLTQRRSFSEVIAELRTMRQERLQGQQANIQEEQIREELRQRASMLSQNQGSSGEPSLDHATPCVQPSNSEGVQAASGGVPASFSQNAFFVARWLYQLIVVFFCSLNPQWGPLVAFILPPQPPSTNTTTTQSGTTTTSTSTTTTTSASTTTGSVYPTPTIPAPSRTVEDVSESIVSECIVSQSLEVEPMLSESIVPESDVSQPTFSESILSMTRAVGPAASNSLIQERVALESVSSESISLDSFCLTSTEPCAMVSKTSSSTHSTTVVATVSDDQNDGTDRTVGVTGVQYVTHPVRPASSLTEDL